MPRLHSFLPTLIILLTSFFGGYLGVKLGLFGTMPNEEPADRTAAPFIRTGNAPIPATALPADFATAAASATPSVVFIKTVSEQAEQYIDFFFYGSPQGKQVSSGSGVIFSANGYVVTNNHVIDGAETIEVIHQRRSYTAKVIGTDPSTDLALLKIEAKALPAITVADSRKLSVGEWVLAVGNPFNLTSTVTAGIVSAKGRNISLLSSQFPIESFIQTDAAINPGNSGGALVNTRGQLVGINTAIFSKTGSYTGYGFAVPSDIVKKVVEDLIKYGTVQKAIFGASVVEVDNALAKKLNLDDFANVVIANVLEDGPAAQSGLKENDVLLKINGQPITGKGVFDEEIAYYNPGDKATIQYLRKGKAGTAMLTFTNKEGTTTLLRKSIFSSKTLGADFETVPRLERERIGLERGVRIVKTYNGGFIRRLGLTEGYILTDINEEPINEPADVERLIKAAQSQLLIQGADQNGRKGYLQFRY
jgi:serine protease Do